jgi:signaling repeat-containing protein
VSPIEGMALGLEILTISNQNNWPLLPIGCCEDRLQRTANTDQCPYSAGIGALDTPGFTRCPPQREGTNLAIMIKNVSYDYRLVALSIVLAIVAAHAVLELTGRLSAARGWRKVFWLAGGSIAMGMGICAMHYVDMCALSASLPVSYHLPIVMLSLMAAIAASAVALFVVSRPTMGIGQEIAGSVAMGIGIAATHYIGMAAMRSSAMILQDRRIVALSIGLDWCALEI